MHITARRVALVCGLIAAPLSAQLAPNARLADSVRVAIEASVDLGELQAIDSTVALAERAAAAFPGDPLLLHYQAYALYRAGAVAFGRYGSGRARPYFDRACDLLEPLVKQTTIPETFGLLASVYGMQIATARVPMLAGMTLGPKSGTWMDRAVADGPRNPRVWVLRGIGALNTPSAFGGGADRAETYLKQAIELFASDAPHPPLPAWGRADAHLWLGQVYARQKRTEAARTELQAALALQPNNGRIRAVLLPALDRQR